MEAHAIRHLDELLRLLEPHASRQRLPFRAGLREQPWEERPLGQILCRECGLAEGDLQRALARQRRDRRRHLGRILVDMGVVSTEQVQAALALKFGIPRIRLAGLEIPAAILERVPAALARQHHLLPLGECGGRLILAMADPLDEAAVQTVRFCTGRQPLLVQAAARDILLAHHKYYSRVDEVRALQDRCGREAPGESSPQAAAGSPIGLSASDLPQNGRGRRRPPARTAPEMQRPLVRLLDAILQQGVLRRASDVHFRPGRQCLEVWYRIDGKLQFCRALDKALQAPLLSRLKVLGGMDIAERRLPQDGGARLRLAGRRIDLRLSVLPTAHGESAVVRILDRRQGLKSLSELGLTQHQLGRLQAALGPGQGLFLVSGPTGAGKTTTLYALLAEMRSGRPHIVSVEDPVEYHLEGVEQIQTLDKKGLDFATALRHILRHDPDVIMVGEIRDAETATIACRAALTGHLVLSTLHTRDAAEAVIRLRDLGVPSHVLAAVLRGVMAQRLVRLNCPHCRERDPFQESLRPLLQAWGISRDRPFQRGAGCVHCHHSGYQGRTVVAEVLQFDGALVDLVSAGAGADALRRRARAAGMAGLSTHALSLALRGRTSLQELLGQSLLALPEFR